MIKVFIVDDHYMVVEGIQALLDNEKDIEFIGSASSVNSCKAFLQKKQPDVLLMDISLPDGSGIDLCKEVHQKYPAIFILGLSTFNQESFIKEMLDNGASGYILKNVTRIELNQAIHTVAIGKKYLAFDVAKVLSTGRKNFSEKIVISRREKQVLELISLGLINNEIAGKLAISHNTVDTYRKSLLLKLDAKNTADLIRLAFLHKLISVDQK